MTLTFRMNTIEIPQSLAPNLSGAGPNSTSDNGGSFGHQARGKRRRTAADPPVDTVPTASASQVCDRTGFPHAGSPVPLVQLQLGSVSEQQSEAKVMEPHGSTAQTRPHPASPGALSAVSQDPSFPAVDASEAMAINIGDGGDNSGDGAGGPVHTGGRPIMTASATPLHPPPLPHANRHMPHHHHDTLLPPSGASPEPSVLSTAAPATTTATATTPAPQPWPGFEPPRPPLPPLPPYQHQHPHQHRDLFDSGRLQQQQQQHLFPSGGAAAEAGAAPQAGFAGLAGAGGFGGALAAIPTAGWAEPIRQLYALLDYVALQEAMVSGRLTTLRVHWINQPPALVHQAVEVFTVPQDCTLGFLKRLICKASGGAVWPRIIQPMRHDPSQGRAAPFHHEGASVPSQRPCVHSAAAPLQPTSTAERPFACGHPHGVRNGGADASDNGGGGGIDVFNPSGAAANPARPASAAGSRQSAQQTSAFLTGSLLPLNPVNPDCGALPGRWDPAVLPPSVSPPCQGLGVMAGEHQGGRVNAAGSGITGDGSTGQGVGGDAGGEGAGAGEGGSVGSAENDASTLAEAGILPDSHIAMEADLQLSPSHQQLLMALLQTQAMAAAAAVSTGLSGFHNPLQGSLPTAAAAAAAAAVAVTASAVAAANQPSSSTGLMGLPAEAGADGEGDGADGSGGREFRGAHQDGGGSSGSRLSKGSYGGALKERFTLQEMSALVSGIEEFGLKWALIKKSRKELQNKNQGDLKDKWRNWQRNVAVSWMTSRVTIPDQLRDRINALVAAAQRGELPTHTTPNLHVLQQRACGMTAFQQHHSNPHQELQQQRQPQQQQQQFQTQQQSGPEALSLQASTAIATVAAAAAAAAAMATGRPPTAGAAPMPADEVASRRFEMPGPALAAEAVQREGQARPSQQQPQQQEQMLSMTSVAPAARCGRQQQFPLQAGAGGGQQVSDHPRPHQHQQQGQEDGKGEAVAARAAQQQLQLQAAQAAQVAKAAQEAQAQAQAQLAAAAAAVAAAAAGQVDGSCGADMGLLAGIQLAPHGNGHPADTLRCTGLPLALPLSLAVPSSDGVPRLLLPAPAAAVAGTPVPEGPLGIASTRVERGSVAATEPGEDVQQSHEPAHQGGTLNLAASMRDVTTRGSVPPDLVSQLGLGMHMGPLEVLPVSGSPGSEREGAVTHVAHGVPGRSHAVVLLGLAMDPLAGPQPRPHAQAIEQPSQLQLQPQTSQLPAHANLGGAPLAPLRHDDALGAAGLSDPERQQQLAVAVAAVAAAAAGAHPHLLQHLQPLQPLQVSQAQLSAQADVGGASPAVIGMAVPSPSPSPQPQLQQ
ncbi:hypothetical protein Vafri_21021 [Volvox africanus]|uniref:Myb-like domain-containing protein n=1 Tax=Volvox africanus TaxID=51714 RepID=A0A8J4BRY8_9CHLO|nr:hypothetical protein Vafri_21021 [Volvox africanus]